VNDCNGAARGRPPVQGFSLFQGGDSAVIIRLLKEGLRMTTAIVARRLNLSPESGDTPGSGAVGWKHSSMELALGGKEIATGANPWLSPNADQ
jgi:hypothetical protein